MAYSTGSTIIDDDYNIFATGNAAGTGNNAVANINTVWGTGTTTRGYGQTNTVTPVSAGNTITATQWTTLVTRMTNIAEHQDTSITAIGNPSAGDTISVFAALQSNITSIYNNSLNAAANGTDDTTNGTTTTTSAWESSAETTKTITFSSAAALRYFFNAGGQIRFSFSRSGGSASTRNTSWSDLLTATGTLVYTGSGTSKTIAGTTYLGLSKIGGSGSPSVFVTGTGVQNFTPGAAATTVFTQASSTYLYTSNSISITAALNATSTVFTLVATLLDNETRVPDVIDGTLTMNTVIRPPSTTYLTNTGGTPTQNAATWTLNAPY
jgi:hypothetical protein